MKKEGKKKEIKKTNSKKGSVMKTIKLMTITLVIILVSLVSFVGVFKQNRNQIANAVKDYTYAMDINGARTIKLVLSADSSNTENGEENKEENKAEDKTVENYKLARKVIEKRLEKLNIQEYNIALNEENGEMYIEIPENNNTDKVVSKLTTVGKFEILDAETKEVLMDNNTIKSSSVLYNTDTNGTTVYLDITFNNEGKKKLEEISKTYVPGANGTTEENTIEENVVEENTVEEASEQSEESKSTDKKITMKIDDEEIMTTSFNEPIVSGKIQLSVGQASKESSTISDYVTQAQNIAVVLDSGRLPLKYTMEKNQYILSTITDETLTKIEITVAVVTVIALAILVIKYKFKGLLASIAFVGVAALLTLTIRYTNVIVSVESIFGIIVMLVLNYIFTVMVLSKSKEMEADKAITETYKEFFIRVVPICIISIVCSFIKWVPVNSFGMIAFWGLVIIAIYNAIVTRMMLKIDSKK